MAGSLVKGWLSRGVLKPSQVMMMMAMRKSDGGEGEDIEEDNSQRMALKRSPQTFPGDCEWRMMIVAMRKSDDDDDDDADDDGREEGDIEEDNSQRVAIKRSP